MGQAQRFPLRRVLAGGRTHAGVSDDFVTNDFLDRRAIVRGIHRRQGEAVVGARRILIEAAPHQRVTAAQQEAIAGVAHGLRIVAVGERGGLGIHEARVHTFAAAIDHVIEQLAAAARGIHRTQDKKLARVFDATRGIARRLVDVDDDLVARVSGIKHALEAAAHALVGAGRAKAGAFGKGFHSDNPDFGEHGVGL